MTLRDILFTPGLTRPAVVLAGMLAVAIVLLTFRLLPALVMRLARAASTSTIQPHGPAMARAAVPRR
jgi:hypothetical protein